MKKAEESREKESWRVRDNYVRERERERDREYVEWGRKWGWRGVHALPNSTTVSAATGCDVSGGGVSVWCGDRDACWG